MSKDQTTNTGFSGFSGGYVDPLFRASEFIEVYNENAIAVCKELIKNCIANFGYDWDNIDYWLDVINEIKYLKE